MENISKRDVQNKIGWFLELKPCDFRRKLVKAYLKDIRRCSRSSKYSIQAKFLPTKQTPESVSILTLFAGSTLNVVRTAIQELDFVEILDSAGLFDIVWCGTSVIPDVPLENRFVNKFPGASNILGKINLFRTLELHRRFFPYAYKFYPPTWFLPFQKQALFVDSANAGQTNGSQPSFKHTYIVKPDSGTQGKGIYLFQSPNCYSFQQTPTNTNCATNNLTGPDQDPRRSPQNQLSCAASLLELDTSEVRTPNVNGLLPALDVVQRYEENPVLLHGCKTDLRVYVLIETLIPLRIHVYRDGLVRLASQLYQKPEKRNLCKHTMHLTNYAINKLHHPPKSKTTELNSPDQNMCHVVKSETCSLAEANTGNMQEWQCKRSLRDLLQSPEAFIPPEEVNPDNWKHIDPVKLWNELDTIIRLTIFALVPHFKVAYWAKYGRPLSKQTGESNEIPSKSEVRSGQGTSEGLTHDPCCFQILGFDFLLVEPDNHPILLEVNSNPSLRTDALHHFKQWPVSDTQPTTDSPVAPLPKTNTSTTTTTVKSTSSRLIAETATLLSAVLGDRYAEFQRSSVDEQVKGGLVHSTLKLIAKKIRRRRVLAQAGTLMRSTIEPDSPKSQSFLDCNATTAPVQVNQIVDIQLPALTVPQNLEHPARNPLKRVGHPSELISNTTLPTIRCYVRKRDYGRIESTLKRRGICQRFVMPKGFRAAAQGVSVPNSKRPRENKVENAPTVTATEADRNSNTLRVTTSIKRRELKFAKMELIYAEGEKSYERMMAVNLRSCGSEYQSFRDKLIKAKEQYAIKLAGDHNLHKPVVPAFISILNVESIDCGARVMDLLADIFLSVLSVRRAKLRAVSPPKDANLISDNWTSSSGTEMTKSTGIQSQFIPRMDLTSFRSFCRRSRMDALGFSFTELDLVFAKHRNWWQRVYEPDLSRQGREPCYLNGLSFPGFVDLCVQLANHCFPLASKPRLTTGTIHLPEIPLFPQPMNEHDFAFSNRSTNVKPHAATVLRRLELKKSDATIASETEKSKPQLPQVYHGQAKIESSISKSTEKATPPPQSSMTKPPCVAPGCELFDLSINRPIDDSSFSSLLRFLEHCCITSL
ncbi:Tubulin polyglutamylase ttll11 [Clonorchis sinensis]|uniref:Tubulin polyglutamylase ttll11 n=1 Tax=Clonorchis sinensis TaxID=79923 RepID=A0A8T1LYL1_CLOSI|nr:Tubulin polyglutamylase ttll11 [Clonorchis sinensis]